MIFPMMTFVVHFASRLSTKIISIKPTFYPWILNTSKLFSTLKSLNKVRINIQGVLYLVFSQKVAVFVVVWRERNSVCTCFCKSLEFPALGYYTIIIWKYNDVIIGICMYNELHK
jgi:hypothetical protein